MLLIYKIRQHDGMIKARPNPKGNEVKLTILVREMVSRYLSTVNTENCELSFKGHMQHDFQLRATTTVGSISR